MTNGVGEGHIIKTEMFLRETDEVTESTICIQREIDYGREEGRSDINFERVERSGVECK